MRKDKRKHRIRPTKREQYFKKQKLKIEELEVDFPELERGQKAKIYYDHLLEKINDSYLRTDNLSGAIRANYLNQVQKQRVLKELEQECRKLRGLFRRVYSLHVLFLGG